MEPAYLVDRGEANHLPQRRRRNTQRSSHRPVHEHRRTHRRLPTRPVLVVGV